MLIKVKRSWKDYAEGPAHRPLTRRDFLMRGMATGAMSVAMNQLVFGDLIRKAMADTSGVITCPPPNLAKGAIAQIYAVGGPTMGARFMSTAQAQMIMNPVMGSSMASNYGVSGVATNMMQLGPASSSNFWIDVTSPWGATLLQGPEGYPGGSAAWQTNVLSKVSAGGHLGPLNQDDGAGQNTGLLGAVGSLKASQLSKDLLINNSLTAAPWAGGLAASQIPVSNNGSGNQGLTTANLSNVFSLIPAATGLTSSTNLSGASDASNAIAKALGPVFNIANRKGSSALTVNAGCAFYGNAAMASPTYGASLFNPANISNTQMNTYAANITATEELALLAAYYQSAAGVAGGVITQFNGRDYHNTSPQNSIAPADIEEARAVVMFLAACDAAGARGAMIYVANGQAIASGTTATTNTIGKTANVALNTPTAQSDAGGSYNGALIIFYDPVGSPPAAKWTGTINPTSGNATVDLSIGNASPNNAIAGLFYSALAWTNGGTVTAQVQSQIQSAGISSRPSTLMVF